MVAIKLQNFGGMIPALDPRLLPNDHASNSTGTWVYTGALEGIWSLESVHTLADPLARKVFRVPFDSYSVDRIRDSTWLEFSEQNVDVLKTPIADDSFDRLYFCGSGVPASYNTRARAISGDPRFVLGIPGPTEPPVISRAPGAFFLAAGGTSLALTGYGSQIFRTMAYELDSDSFGSGGVDDSTARYAGETRPVSSLRGNVDQSPTPPPVDNPANMIRILGQPAEMRYTTTISGNRVTISDSGEITRGLPPAAAPSSVSSDYEGVGVLEYRAYVYTWVSAYGEEGPPSPPGIFVGYSGDPWVVRLTAPTAGDLLNRNLTHVRVYRTITGVEGSTSFFQVIELPIATLQFTDTVDTLTVAGNQQLQSTFWTAPPTDLAGFSLMPNGIMVGWRNNEVWFSEPYRPHAWPSPYVLTVEYPVVGLGVMGQSAVICTSSTTYTASGINPATMTMSRVPGVKPCVSRGSILSTPRGVVYAAADGLVLATPSELLVLTKGLVDPDQWQDSVNFLTPTTLRASTLGAAYYAWGSTQVGCFDGTAFDNDAFLQTDFTGSYLGAMIDLENNRVSYNKLASDVEIRNCFEDSWTGETLVIRDGQVFHLNRDAGRPRDAYTWRSKVMETPNQRSFEAMRVYFGTYPFTPELNPVRNVSQVQELAADQWGIVRVYADDRLVVVRELRQSGEIFRIPAGFKATFWEVEVEARVKVYSVELATTAKELQSV